MSDAVTLLLEHESLAHLIGTLAALIAVYWRLVVRIERIEQREIEAVVVRNDMKMALLRIDEHKVDQKQCDRLHGGMENVFDALRAEIRALNASVVELATLIRRNGS